MRVSIIRPLALLLLLSASAGTAAASVDGAGAAPTTIAVDEREHRLAVERLATALERFYVIPAIGNRYAALLRAKLRSGAYDRVASDEAFADQVTADLQALHRDAHLRLAPAGGFERPRPNSANLPASARPNGPPGLEEAKMIGTTAYLRFNMFPEDGGVTAKRARDFLLAHAGDARALIIDERPHRGGGSEVMDAIFPLLFGEQRTLVRLDMRAAAAQGERDDSPAMVRRKSEPGIVRDDYVVIPDTSETRLRTVPIYVLTSRRSASAAEHLALSMKISHRATLIGETTRGAGHFGRVMPMGKAFAAFIPAGRTYDPATGLDWEGVGVTPDVACNTDEALDEALRRIASSDHDAKSPA
jgi:hypothetical protein